MSDTAIPSARPAGDSGNDFFAGMNTPNNRRRAMIGLGVAALLAGAVWLVTGQNRPEFTIQRGDNLVQRIGYEPAIRTADRFDLPIFLGTPSNPRSERIDVKTALAVDTDHSQVMVPVYPGDRFNLKRFGGGFVPGAGSPHYRG
ncbi:MAG TPA: hypothetical protein VGE53_02705 [Candidatus Paceibacterota bacterium]